MLGTGLRPKPRHGLEQCVKMQKTLFTRCKYFGIGTCTTKYVISYFCFNNLKVFLAQSSTFNNPRDYFHFDNETNFIKA